MDRRSLFAIVLTFGILIAWEAFYMAPKRGELARRQAAALEESRRADSLAALEKPAPGDTAIGAAAAVVAGPKPMTLESILAQVEAGQVKELNLILKTDVQGSIEPIVNSVEKLGTETIRVNLLHTGTGNINESDTMLAVASKAIIIGFNVQVDAGASRMADSEGVDVRTYDIIYKLIDDIDRADHPVGLPDGGGNHAELPAAIGIPQPHGNAIGAALVRHGLAWGCECRLSPDIIGCSTDSRPSCRLPPGGENRGPTPRLRRVGLGGRIGP